MKYPSNFTLQGKAYYEMQNHYSKYFKKIFIANIILYLINKTINR